MVDIISKEYYSNCMVEAFKAKLRNPKVKIYFCRPRITENKHFQMFHFMWSDGKADYDFSDLEENGLPPYRTLWFKGAIRKFDLGFAASHTKYRNRKKEVFTMKMNATKKMPSKATVARTLVLTLALANSAFSLAGKSPLPFSDSQVTEAVSYIFTAAAAIVSWWKNNSFTQKAIAADTIMKESE